MKNKLYNIYIYIFTIIKNFFFSLLRIDIKDFIKVFKNDILQL